MLQEKHTFLLSKEYLIKTKEQPEKKENLKAETQKNGHSCTCILVSLR